MKRIVFFDIDGTLIDSMKGMKDISPKVKQIIKDIQRRGDYAFIATGRPYGFLPNSILDFGFDGFILANGAHIIVNNETIYSDSIDKIFIKNLVDELENNNVEYVLQGEKHCYMKNHFNNFHNYLDKIEVPKKYIKDEYNCEDIHIHKVEMLCKDDEMENFNDLKNLYEDGYRCIYQDGTEGNRNIYLKNFEDEKSTVINIQDENEFSQFQDYISNLRMS